MELDEKWIREHLPEDCRNDRPDWFGGLYLDGLTVMSEGERGDPRYTGLMNRWFLSPHWGYDFEKLCFIEISHSREYRSDFDKSAEINDHNIVKVVD